MMYVILKDCGDAGFVLKVELFADFIHRFLIFDIKSADAKCIYGRFTILSIE